MQYSGLANTGCEFLVYAPESGSQRVLDIIKKRVNLMNLEKSIKIALKYNLIVKVNFIIGFPFEKRMDIIKTLLLVWKLAWLKVDDCNIATFSPYPGSELFQELVDKGEIEKIDDAYFENLISQFDFTTSKIYCRNVGALEVLFYRVIGMSLFYALSYIRRPKRLLSLIAMVFQRKPFTPRSLFEQRIFDFIVRSQTEKVTNNRT